MTDFRANQASLKTLRHGTDFLPMMIFDRIDDIEDGRKMEIMVGLKVNSGLSGKTLWERRELLRNQENVHFVDPEQFCALAVSCRRITRADESAAGLKGLYSEDEGKTYFVEEERLDRYREGVETPDPSYALS